MVIVNIIQNFVVFDFDLYTEIVADLYNEGKRRIKKRITMLINR